MIKTAAVTLLVVAALAVGTLVGGGRGRAANPADGTLAHRLRAFGYELSVGARLSRLPHTNQNDAETMPSCPARIDTVFVLLLPTGDGTGGGS